MALGTSRKWRSNVKLHSAKGECQRCSQRWAALNAQGLAAQHETKTGHPVQVTLVYRSDGRPKTAAVGMTLQFDNPERPRR